MMFKNILLVTLIALVVGGCSSSSDHKQMDNPMKVDTGVGKNGVALPSNPSFTKSGGVKVDMKNFIRAETAKYFAEETILSGGNQFRHERHGISLDHQTVIRSNFDAIYSYGVFDASKGLIVTVPKYDLYHSVQVFDENHVTLGVAYAGQSLRIDSDSLTHGKHVYLFMRTQPRTYNEKGMNEVRLRQDQVIVKNPSKTRYVSDVKYDVESFNKLRSQMIARAPKEVKTHLGFISSLDDIVEPHYQMANTAGWGGLPANDAFYFVLLPGDEKAKKGQCSSTTFKAPELKYSQSAFWSITVYNSQGWVEKVPFNTNSKKAKPNKDGTYTIHFNCGEHVINNLNVPDNWNALFRSYLPVSVKNIIRYQKMFEMNNPILSMK